MAVPQRESVFSPTFEGPRRSLRLRTLLALRWLAIAGQTVAVLFVHFGLGFKLPLLACLCVIGASAWLNVFLAFAHPNQRLTSAREATMQLAFDLAQLALLLGLTGGLNNPFVILFVAPVTIAAASLRPQYTMILGLFALCAIAMLAAFGLPLPWIPGEAFTLPPVFKLGLGAALVIGLVFTAVYAYRVSSEEERLADALTATQAVLAREQRLAALGGLAAAAAHELGTPLATIQVTAKEMTRELPEGPLLDDARLLVSQTERCRDILRRLSAGPDSGDVMVDRQTLGQLLEEAAGRHPDIPGAILRISTKGPGDDAALVLKRTPEVLYGLGNLMQNAMEFAATTVEIKGEWDQKNVTISIGDDGPGFDSDVLPRLGEPYVTSRGQEELSDGYEGMGLGFFIAKTLLERSGATVNFRNKTPPDSGASVRIVWPRASIEALPL
jgi:two-component system sensor histidine kinase RegB